MLCTLSATSWDSLSSLKRKTVISSPTWRSMALPVTIYRAEDRSERLTLTTTSTEIGALISLRLL